VGHGAPPTMAAAKPKPAKRPDTVSATSRTIASSWFSSSSPVNRFRFERLQL
jgi:hypothetical protein